MNTIVYQLRARFDRDEFLPEEAAAIATEPQLHDLAAAGLLALQPDLWGRNLRFANKLPPKIVSRRTNDQPVTVD